MDIETIIDGWKHYFVRDAATEEIAVERLKICFGCNRRNKLTQQCKICNCFIPSAVRAKNKRCLINKW